MVYIFYFGNGTFGGLYTWPIIYIGIILMTVGLLGMITLFVRDCAAPQIMSDIIKNKYFALLLLPLLVGSQILSFGVIAHSFIDTKRFQNFNKNIVKLLEWFKLEKGLMASFLLMSAGVIIMLFLILTNYFMSPVLSVFVRNDLSIISISIIVISIQVFYLSFLLSNNTKEFL